MIEEHIQKFREEVAERLNRIAVKATSEYIVAVAEGDVLQSEKSYKIVRIIEETRNKTLIQPIGELNDLLKTCMEEIDRL